MTFHLAKCSSDAPFAIVGHFVLGANCVCATRQQIPVCQLANYPINPINPINAIIPFWGRINHWINRINRNNPSISSMPISDWEVGRMAADDPIGIYPLTGIRVYAYEFPLTVICENAYD